MAITFYPHEDDLSTGSVQEKLEVLLSAAERFKAVILDATTKTSEVDLDPKKRMIPREMSHAFNWEELAKLLRVLRDLPEVNQASRLEKATKLTKLAEVYEVLRGAKMPKLEAVRLALVNEANQLRSSKSTSAA